MTTDVEWINDGKSAIINGWYFHFSTDWMCAFRGTGKLERRELILKYADSDILSWYDRYYALGFDDISNRRFAGHRDMVNGKEVWYAFFTPPEDRFNQVVQEAYETYLLETAIRNNESS